MTQTERLARRDELRAEIAKHESQLAALRAEEAELDECDHNYAGPPACHDRRAREGPARDIAAACCRHAISDKLWG